MCDSRVWALERKVFQHVMVSSGLKRIENQVTLNTVSLSLKFHVSLFRKTSCRASRSWQSYRER